MLFSMGTARRSLKALQPAEVVIVNSHFDIFAFRMVSLILRCNLPRIVLPAFIFTEKKGLVKSFLNKKYFSWILQFADGIICHSRKEVDSNTRRFPRLRGRFMYYPYGIHVCEKPPGIEATLASKNAVCAGRSGRDFDLLLSAAQGVPAQFQIICDQFPKRLTKKLTDQFVLLDNCYHKCYFDELKDSRFVVIPLRSDDISAGQMVLLQAMSMGKPCVITETGTTRDYIREGAGMLSVPLSDKDALSAAMTRLCVDDDLCVKLAHEAEQEFGDKYSIEAYARNLVASANRVCGYGVAGRGDPSR
jgi:glycosyltransferase involved in cell wall biosynthesis